MRYFQKINKQGNCSRCGGSGHLPQYNHIQGGACFKCNGCGNDESRKKRRF
ncbi:MAG: hypothetical protein P8N19_01430 [Flavobacteriales bacterium]|nr:hypothetical protein [Flavobacteriales bacterium]